MVLLLIKKTFFDLWDNLYSMFLFGVATIVVAAFFMAMMVTVGVNSPKFFLAFIGGIFCLGQLIAALFFYTHDIAMNEQVKIRNIVGYIAQTWKVNLVISGIFSTILILTISGVRFYMHAVGPVAVVGTGVLAGTAIIVGLVLLFFYPFYIRSEEGIIDAMKKSAFFISDNPVFVIGVIIGIITICAMSAFSYGIAPGFTAITLWINVCVRIRLYKYEYRKSTKTVSGNIPWDDLIKEDLAMYDRRWFVGKTPKKEDAKNKDK